MRIAPLADRPDRIPEIAASLWTKWGYRSLAHCAEDLRQARRDTLPVAYVALDDDRAMGIVSLIECNLPTRCDLTPWLAGLFVWPHDRNQGLGTALVTHVETAARELGYDRLYLYTRPAEAFYERLGWMTIARDQWEESEIAIMSRELRS